MILTSRTTDNLSGWQPIETAPKDGTKIDLWAAPRRYADQFWSVNGWANKEPRSRHLVTIVRPGLNPTHWMPLPEPPS